MEIVERALYRCCKCSHTEETYRPDGKYPEVKDCPMCNAYQGGILRITEPGTEPREEDNKDKSQFKDWKKF